MMKQNSDGQMNPAFAPDLPTSNDHQLNEAYNDFHPPHPKNDKRKAPPAPVRETWGHGLEFLMSCIAMSVGLGNIWRFPFTAYENGGGAFLIPYIIVLILVGKPLYFMEMVLGQFSSKGSVKVYDFAPIMRGIGVGQTIAVLCVMTYYSSVMALILHYFISSFSSVLPWSVCDPSWPDECYPSSGDHANVSSNAKSSSVLYFGRTVLREVDNLDNGIGTPSPELTLCLVASWTIVFLVLWRGVKSLGKASYFLAIFPYAVMLVLFARALTLEGSGKGIVFFITPNWDTIFDAKVWYAAVTQSFFSLNVCFGSVVMYSSYNEFRHSIYRDTLVITTLDTFTSLLSGFTIFGILGNLAYETNKEVADVVNGGAGLAFISYPDAISKFKSVPQLFSALFFLMLFVLGNGSNVAMASSIITVIKDKFPHVQHWQAAAGVAIFGFCVALVYITPGGQFILNLVDHHGGTFIVFILGIGQVIAVSYIYGLQRFTDDIEFMLSQRVGYYWRICWSVVTPLILIVILLYSLVSLAPLTYKGIAYPVVAIACGWLVSASGIIQLPIFAGITILKKRNLGYPKMITKSIEPSSSWGPRDPETLSAWIRFTEDQRIMREERDAGKSTTRKFFDRLFGI